ncbi:hypothetical protein BGZ82_011788 [Podila clonocystis]|nr:hypothetical protein BGZ82_011788 [Podila clonocystis]
MRWSTSNTHGFACRAISIALLALLLSTPSSHTFGVEASPVALPNILKHNHIDGDLVDSSFLSGQAFADASNINNDNNIIITPVKPTFPQRILLQLKRASSSPSSSSRPSPSPPSPRFLSAYETIVNSDSQLPMFLDHKLQQQQQQRRRAKMGKLSKDPHPSDNHSKNAIDSNEALRPRITANNVQNNMVENAMGPQGPGDEVEVVTHDRSSIQAVSSESNLETDKNRWALRNSRGMDEEMDGKGVVVENKEEEATLVDMSETRMAEEKAGVVAPEDLSSGMQVQQPSSEGASFSEEHLLSRMPAEVQVEDIPVPKVEPIVVQHSDHDVLEPQLSIHKRSSQSLHRRVVTSASSSPPPPRSALHSALTSAFVMAASGLALSFVVVSYSMYSRRREKSPLGFFHYLTQGVFNSSYSYAHVSEASLLLPVATIPSPTSAAFPCGVSALSSSSSSSSGDSSEEPEIAVSSCAQMTSSPTYKDVGRRSSRQLLESKVEHLYDP